MLEIQFEDFILPKYKKILDFNEEVALVQDYNGLWGYINKRGKEVIPCQYLDAGNFSEGLAYVQDKITKKYGYITQKNNVVIPFLYSDAKNFSEELAAVKNNNDLWGYINKENVFIIECAFRSAKDFKNGFAEVEINVSQPINKSYINKDGKTSGNYTLTLPYSNGFAVASVLGENYILSGDDLSTEKNTSMNIIIQGNSYGLIRAFDKNNRKFGFIDKNSNYVFFPVYQKARDFKNDASIVEVDDELIGFIDKKGFSAFFSKKYEYEYIADFSEELACVKNINGLWGFINKGRCEIISCVYKKARSFSNGLAAVEDSNGNLFYINNKNTKKIIIPSIYSSVLKLSDKIICITAETIQELNEKKLKVLETLKAELLQNINLQINDILEEQTSELYELNKIKSIDKK